MWFGSSLALGSFSHIGLAYQQCLSLAGHIPILIPGLVWNRWLDIGGTHTAPKYILSGRDRTPVLWCCRLGWWNNIICVNTKTPSPAPSFNQSDWTRLCSCALSISADLKRRAYKIKKYQLLCGKYKCQMLVDLHDQISYLLHMYLLDMHGTKTKSHFVWILWPWSSLSVEHRTSPIQTCVL